MKKILFVVMSVVAMTFASCGGATKASDAANDSDTVVVDTLAVDSASVDTVVAE